MALPHAKADLLFVNDWVYKSRTERRICDLRLLRQAERHRGAKECNELALQAASRPGAICIWYLKPLAEACAVVQADQIEFDAAEG